MNGKRGFRSSSPLSAISLEDARGMQRDAARSFSRGLIPCGLFLSSCNPEAQQNVDQESVAVTTTEKAILEDTVQVAHVSAVSVSGDPPNYLFAVEIMSPDEGCNQYADWWEILTEEGELIYRRILLHSHIAEQPFTRSGGPVVVGETDVLIVRAHMVPDGYGGMAFRGSVEDGFQEYELNPGFAAEVEMLDPQPVGCDG